MKEEQAARVIPGDAEALQRNLISRLIWPHFGFVINQMRNKGEALNTTHSLIELPSAPGPVDNAVIARGESAHVGSGSAAPTSGTRPCPLIVLWTAQQTLQLNLHSHKKALANLAPRCLLELI
jgi:hypothetical protein